MADEKVFSIEQGKYIDKPATETTTADTETETVDSGTETTETEASTETAETTDTTETSEKESKETKDKPTTFEPGSYLSQKYGEKYGIEKEEDLDEILSSQEEVLNSYEELQAKYKELEEKSKNPYGDPHKQQIAEFLSDINFANLGDGLVAAGILKGLDIPNLSEKKALQEAFVLKNPKLAREKAITLFNEDYNSKYEINKDDFEDDAKFERKKELNAIRLEQEAVEAREFLSQKREKLKEISADPNKDRPADTPAKFEIPAETLQQYQQDIEKALKPAEGKVFDRLVFKSDDGKEVWHTIKFDAKQQAQIKDFMKAYVELPGNYDPKTGKITNFDAKALAQQAPYILFGQHLMDEMWKGVKSVAAKMKAEQIASQAPDKKSTAGGDGKLSIDDQFRKLAEKERAQRQQGRR